MVAAVVAVGEVSQEVETGDGAGLAASAAAVVAVVASQEVDVEVVDSAAEVEATKRALLRLSLPSPSFLCGTVTCGHC